MVGCWRRLREIDLQRWIVPRCIGSSRVNKNPGGWIWARIVPRLAFSNRRSQLTQLSYFNWRRGLSIVWIGGSANRNSLSVVHRISWLESTLDRALRRPTVLVCILPLLLVPRPLQNRPNLVRCDWHKLGQLFWDLCGPERWRCFPC